MKKTYICTLTTGFDNNKVIFIIKTTTFFRATELAEKVCSVWKPQGYTLNSVVLADDVGLEREEPVYLQ